MKDSTGEVGKGSTIEHKINVWGPSTRMQTHTKKLEAKTVPSQVIFQCILSSKHSGQLNQVYKFVYVACVCAGLQFTQNDAMHVIASYTKRHYAYSL